MFNEQHIVVIARGDAGSGKICLSPNKFFLTNLAIAILLKDKSLMYYLYYHLLSLDTFSLRSGSAQAQVTINSLKPFEIIIPSSLLCKEFNSHIKIINNLQRLLNKENLILAEMQSLLLTQLAN